MEESESLLGVSTRSYGASEDAILASLCNEDDTKENSVTSVVTYPMSDLISSKEHFTRDEIIHNIKLTRVLCVLTLLMTCILTILSFVASQDSGSSAAFGFAFDSFLAGLTSSIILWRFWSVKELEQRNRRRELLAHIIIVVALIAAGFLVGYKAIKALVRKEKHKKSTMLLVLAVVSLLLYVVLFVMKYRLAKRLGSRALRTDSIDALCGAILSLSIVVTTATREYTTKTWFLDPVIALGVAVFSIAYGLYSTVCVIKLRKEYKEYMKQCERNYNTPPKYFYLPQA